MRRLARWLFTLCAALSLISPRAGVCPRARSRASGPGRGTRLKRGAELLAFGTIALVAGCGGISSPERAGGAIRTRAELEQNVGRRVTLVGRAEHNYKDGGVLTTVDGT